MVAVASHASSVRSQIVIVCAFVVLDEWHYENILAIYKGLKGVFLAVEYFFDKYLLEAADFLLEEFLLRRQLRSFSLEDLYPWILTPLPPVNPTGLIATGPEDLR